LVTNRVRVLAGGPHIPNQLFWEYPTPHLPSVAYWILITEATNPVRRNRIGPLKREDGSLAVGCIRLGSIQNKNNWNNAKKRLLGSYSHSGIPRFPFPLFCSQRQNSRES